MKGVNKVIIIGNLGRDPEIKYTQQSTCITNITVATSESWTDKQSGQKQTSTEWHRVVFYNRLAEIAGQYLAKGSQVYIEGKLKTSKWTDNAGKDNYKTEIVANNLQMLGGKQKDSQPPPPMPPNPKPLQNNAYQKASQGTVNQQQNLQTDMQEDDCPF